MNRRAFAMLSAMSLAGCATYAPLPLDEAPAVLSPPVAAILARDATAIDRPYLKPFALDLTQPLDANGIAVLAVIANPDLKAQRTRAGVADAQSFAAGLLPDPTFSFGIDHILSGPDPFDNIAGSLGFDLNALRNHAAVSAKARADAKQVRLDLAWAEWQAAGQARIQAVHVMGLERTVALNQASYRGTQSLLDRTLRASGRGDLSGDQVQAARTAVLDATDRYRISERDLAAARFELARLVGLQPGSAIRLAPAALPGDALDAARLFALAETGRSDLQALRAGYSAQEAAVRKAVLDQFPTLDLTINGARDTGGNKLLGPSIGFTLPLWNRNRGGIAVERATREALKAEYEARLFQTRAEIAAAVGGIGVARHQRQDLVANLPALARFAAASRRAADRGDLAPATAETAEQALRDKQALLTQSEQDIGEQMIALELLTGAPREAWTQ